MTIILIPAYTHYIHTLYYTFDTHTHHTSVCVCVHIPNLKEMNKVWLLMKGTENRQKLNLDLCFSVPTSVSYWPNCYVHVNNNN